MSRVLLGVGAAVVALSIGWLAWRAHREPAVGTASSSRDVPHLEGSRIRFSPAFAERSGLELATPESTALSPIINVTGTVVFDPARVAAVGARIRGRVRKVFKVQGDTVAVGEALAEIESAELGQAQSDVTAAHARAEAANANERREAQLALAKVSSERDADLARAQAVEARAAVTAAEQRIRALGGGAVSDVGVLLLKSPLAGKLIEGRLSRGQTVDAEFTAFRVADLSHVWVELAVFERQLVAIHEGDKVEVAPQTDLSRLVVGQVAHVGDVIDLDTRSASVRVVVPNVNEGLRPGQSVLARVHVTAPLTATLLLPRTAITRVDGKPTIFVAQDDTSVEPRSVELGAQDATRVEVTDGLKPGERVVVQGVFALKSELFR